MNESINQQPKEEQLLELRKQITRAEQSGDEARVLELERRIHQIEGAVVSETPFDSYRYLEHSNDREDIILFTRGVCEYLRREKVAHVFFMDRSARPAWVSFHEYYKQKYPNEQRPGFFFTNPKAYEPRRTTRGMFSGLLASITGADLHVEHPAGVEFKETYTTVIEDKNKPILLFDTCAHSGMTINNVRKVLEEIGFSDVRIITASDPEEGSAVRSELSFDDHKSCETCYPFGLENGQIAKRKSSIVSKVREPQADHEIGMLIRKELRQIIKEANANGTL